MCQRIEIVQSDAEKRAWLARHLATLVDVGEVLVFAGTRAKVEELASELSGQGFRAGAIHGDLDPVSRATVLEAFRSGQVHVLVATDVAARGLDIKQLQTVVNYDAGKSIDSYIHRIGRTGRAGDKEGVAYTLLLASETYMAGEAGLGEAIFQVSTVANFEPCVVNKVKVTPHSQSDLLQESWSGVCKRPGRASRSSSNSWQPAIHATDAKAGTRRAAREAGNHRGYAAGEEMQPLLIYFKMRCTIEYAWSKE